MSSTRHVAALRESLARLSLRTRLLAILLLLLVLALTATGYLTQFVLHQALQNKVDEDLRSTRDNITQYQQYWRPSRPWNRGGPPSSYVVGVLSYTGGAVNVMPEIRSSDVNATPAWPSLSRDQVARIGSKLITLHSDGPGPEWRAATLPASDGYVMIALPLNRVDETVAEVRAVLLMFGLLATGGCVVLGWVAIRRAFAPLSSVEDTAAAIAAGDLSRRVPVRPASTEVGRLTSSLNGMLSQIEAAFRAREASEARTRRFAADASHELRTPLASVRGYAELYRQGAVIGDEDVARTMRRIEDEATRMASLVDDLLLLARLDEKRPGRQDPVDLAVLAGDAVHDAGALDPQRRVRLIGLDHSGPAPAVVIGDEDRLRQVVANLVANAIRHTPPNTPVEVAVGVGSQSSGPAAVLEVRDHGRGLTPEQAERVFERFFRLDGSRSRSSGGSGLGLSIVAAVVASHGGTVSVHQTPGGGATFRVSLPQRPAHAVDTELDLGDADPGDTDLGEADLDDAEFGRGLGAASPSGGNGAQHGDAAAIHRSAGALPDAPGPDR